MGALWVYGDTIWRNQCPWTIYAYDEWSPWEVSWRVRPCFLDDILLYSASMEEHVEHLHRVLFTLRKYELYAKASKCGFVTTTIEFLGQQISVWDMSPMEAKAKAICEWDMPQNVKDVHSFLGFVNYY